LSQLLNKKKRITQLIIKKRIKTVTTDQNEPPKTCNSPRLNPLATTASPLHIEHHIEKGIPHNDLNMTT
jgi:hypothetical protein